MNGKIFIIEDEPSIIQLVQHNLEKNGFIVSSSVNGNDGLKELKKFQPDLLLLDWMLPDLSGIEICKNIRKDNSIKNLPVIMLTAKGEEEDKIKGLDSGVDDYLTKPFSFNELMARIKAVLRRSNPNTVSDNLKFEDGLMMIGRDPNSGLAKYGPGSVLSGQNVVSGFGTNDYEKQLGKYISKMLQKKKRYFENKSSSNSLQGCLSIFECAHAALFLMLPHSTC